VAGIAQVRRGLSPFQELRERLSTVRDGRAARLTGAYPEEVQPLVDDLNQLLEHREAAIARAVGRAGDLAHGLKTPLAVLAHEADRLNAAGHAELAESLSQQVDRMRRQIDYHLAYARAAASGATAGQRTRAAAAIDGLVRALTRLHTGRGVSIDADVPADLLVPARREDLDEMVGNLLDNGCRWAASRVRVSAAERDGRVEIVVDDDGPGIAAAMRPAVLQRGVRADEGAPGSGFGLAITREIAELYGGGLRLDTSPLGGLRAVISWPGPSPADPVS
jgi:signal transduction histidine kinase